MAADTVRVCGHQPGASKLHSEFPCPSFHHIYHMFSCFYHTYYQGSPASTHCPTLTSPVREAVANSPGVCHDGGGTAMSVTV